MQRTILVFIFCLFINGFCFGQLSNSELKVAYQKIDEAYGQEEYAQVLMLIKALRDQYAPLDARTYQIWMDLAYQKHDLQIAVQMAKSLNYEKKKKKIIRTNGADFENRLEKLTILADGNFAIAQDKTLTQLEKSAKILALLQVESSFWQPHYARGQALFKAGLYEEAIVSLNNVAALNPNWSLVHYNLAESYMNIKNYEKALYHADEFIEQNGMLLQVPRIKYFAEYHLGQYENCIKTVRAYLKVSKDSATLYSAIYDCANKLGKYNLQVKTGIKLAAFNNDESLVDEIGNLYRYAKNTERIDFTIDSLIKAHPTNSIYYIVKAQFYIPHDDANYDKAIANFNSLINLDQNNWYYYYLKGKFIRESITARSMDEKARTARKIVGIDALEKSLELNPDHFETYYYLCYINIWYNSSEMRRYRKMAYERMAMKLKRNGASAQGYFHLAEAYDLPVSGYGDDNKYRDSTLKYYELALQNGMDSFAVLKERCHEADCEQAIKDCEWIITKSDNPDFRRGYLYRLATCYGEQGAYKKEYDVYMIIRKESPSSQLERRIKEVEKKM
jgi:predicted Zn-dependent protease